MQFIPLNSFWFVFLSRSIVCYVHIDDNSFQATPASATHGCWFWIWHLWRAHCETRWCTHRTTFARCATLCDIVEFAVGMGWCYIVWHYIHSMDHAIKNHALQSNIGLIDLNVQVFFPLKVSVCLSFFAHTHNIQHKCNPFETMWI